MDSDESRNAKNCNNLIQLFLIGQILDSSNILIHLHLFTMVMMVMMMSIMVMIQMNE